jgi:hypothetical protein
VAFGRFTRPEPLQKLQEWARVFAPSGMHPAPLAGIMFVVESDNSLGKREGEGRVRGVGATDTTALVRSPRLGDRWHAALHVASDATQGAPDGTDPNLERLCGSYALPRHRRGGEGDAPVREPAKERDGRGELRLLPLPRHARIPGLRRRRRRLGL